MISLRGKPMASFSGEYICRNDKQLTFESDAAGLSDMFGYTSEEMREVCGDGMAGLIHPDYRNVFHQKLDPYKNEEVLTIFH